MSGFKVAFQSVAGQGEALSAAGGGAAQLARELRDLAGSLGSYGGMEVFSAPLAALGERVATCGGRIAALGSRLEEIHALYLRTEEGMAREMGGTAAEPTGGGRAAGTPSAGSPADVSPTVSGPAADPAAPGDSPYGGVTGEPSSLWDWLSQEHNMWEAGVSGSALGGVAAGTAGISALHYESDFHLGGKYSDKTKQPFDGDATREKEFALGVGAGGSLSLLHAEAEGRLGGDYAGLYGEAAGDVGVVTVGGTAGVFADEDGDLFAGAKGEAGVYAAKGEVTGGLDLGFMKIGGTLEGSVGAGVSGEIGYDDGSFKIGGSAALGLGGGFSLSIDLSPTIDWLTSLF